VDLDLSDEQQHLRDTFDALLAKHCTVGHVRDAESTGFDPHLWDLLTRTGLVGLAVPEASGGAGGGLLELGLVAEACGASLAPVPFVEAPVAARLLSSFAAVAPDTFDDVLSGDRLVVFTPGIVAAEDLAPLVPFGAVAERVVALHRNRLVMTTPPSPLPRRPNLGAGALADVPLGSPGSGDVVLAAGDDASRRYAVALREWHTVMAAALTGLAGRALAIAVEYVTERRQFGRPIGSFQVVGHRLADVATEVDGARLLWQEAACALDEGDENAPVLARMAFLFASDVAERATSWSLHFHGGYGFMLEYDIQLFYRRAKAWPLAVGSRRSELQRFADGMFGSNVGQPWIFG
jgi:alkylation response protein AidB-like acyl-CoA dehydrogenase